MFWFAGCTCSPCCNMEAFMWCLGSYLQAFLKITFWGSPFIYPIYGLGGLPEGLDLDLSDAACHRCIGLEKNVNLGFSRLAAIHRGTYMLLGSSWAIVSFVHRDQGQNMMIYHKILFTFVFYLCFFLFVKDLPSMMRHRQAEQVRRWICLWRPGQSHGLILCCDRVPAMPVMPCALQLPSFVKLALDFNGNFSWLRASLQSTGLRCQIRGRSCKAPPSLVQLFRIQASLFLARKDSKTFILGNIYIYTYVSAQLSWSFQIPCAQCFFHNTNENLWWAFDNRECGKVKQSEKDWC